jgi:hypothetical protein
MCCELNLPPPLFPAGNMVTNATWSVFWINEGFTMYLVRDRALYLALRLRDASR